MQSVLVGILTVYKQNPNLFEDFIIPEGLDKGILIDNLCLELAELSLIYSEPKTLQQLIGVWSARRNFVWTELYKTLLYKYDPIANYDRTEERVGRLDHINSYATKNVSRETFAENLQGNDKNIFKGDIDETWSDSGDGSENGTEHIDKKTDSTQETENNMLHSQYGFNEAEIPAKSWQEESTNDTTGSVTDVQNGTNESTNNWSNNGSSVQNTNNTDTTDRTENKDGNKDVDDLETHREDTIDVDRYKLRAYGNIGVTTTQRLIQEQRDLIQFDIFETIIKEFKGQFCLMRW